MGRISSLCLPEDFWRHSLLGKAQIPPSQARPSSCNADQCLYNPTCRDIMATWWSRSVVATKMSPSSGWHTKKHSRLSYIFSGTYFKASYFSFSVSQVYRGKLVTVVTQNSFQRLLFAVNEQVLILGSYFRTPVCAEAEQYLYSTSNPSIQRKQNRGTHVAYFCERWSEKC